MGSGKKSLNSYPIAEARTAVEKKIYAEPGEEMGECNEVVPAEEMIPEKTVGSSTAPAASGIAFAFAFAGRTMRKEVKKNRKQV